MSAFEVSTVLADAVVRLRAAGVESPRREARLLLAHVLGVQVLDIVAGRSREINEGARAHFEAALKRRVSREPLAYIVGRREFWSLEFAVAPSVLIPRPESEILVEEALRRFPDREAPLRVADLGTGSGCLLLAFLSERPFAKGAGIDASEAALVVAARNARALGLLSRVEFLRGNWTEALVGSFDTIFVNPPYIPSAAITGLAPEVACYEPRLALDGGEDGLAAYRAIAAGLKRHINQGSSAFFEVGEGQAEAVQKVLVENGFAVSGTVCDFAGIPRCLVANAAVDAVTKKELALATRSG
jgi:release factor glutamine methyltransferase